MEIILGIVIFFAGFYSGLKVREMIFNRLDWNLLRWDNGIFAYRTAQKGCVIQRGEKVFMALRVPTSSLPSEGFKYE